MEDQAILAALIDIIRITERPDVGCLDRAIWERAVKVAVKHGFEPDELVRKYDGLLDG